jgi:hypothetical protein
MITKRQLNMTGKAYEEDLIMAIENIGHEMKMQRKILQIALDDIAGSLELIAAKMGHGLE